MLWILAYLGGVLTIVSPCILPVLPFVFARAERPFVRGGLPMLAGMALTFAAVATLAAVSGGWAVRANQYGRVVALVLLTLFALTLLSESLATRIMRPFVALGGRLTALSTSPEHRDGIWSSVLLGVATGLLWAPCAGPILALVLTGAAIGGANASTSLLLLAYAAGAATSLALALAVGGRVFATMKRSLGASEWIRRGLGGAVLVGVVAIASGFDTGVLARASLANTSRLEQAAIDKIRPGPAPASYRVLGSDLGVEGAFPGFPGGGPWFNSPPLTAVELRGKVVLVDFWTYSCINCLRSLPYVRAWDAKYRDHGLVVVGVHAPEFAFERDSANVRRAIADLHVDYPVVLDNQLSIWRAFNNQFWPAHFFIDAQGRIRAHHFGEGQYDESERIIQQLLAESGRSDVPTGLVDPNASGAEARADLGEMQSPETYVGYARAEHFVGGNVTRDAPATYSTPNALSKNEWGLDGRWTVHAELATLDAAPGRITFRFHARDLHLVLGPSADGKPIRFRVTIDGAAPGDSHGADVDASGNGTVTAQRLYQLVRQSGTIGDHTFVIEFLDPGVAAYSFTFG
ncbi:MAG TPA: cytochrome c biogenesis protein DipZ [Gemmatimonadaceae bacterium]|jgi:cytochrome c biogenesis protein CcdA/thiol-disulfide isomerase/thioredoxin